jgi:hypothetical protein
MYGNMCDYINYNYMKSIELPPVYIKEEILFSCIQGMKGVAANFLCMKKIFLINLPFLVVIHRTNTSVRNVAIPLIYC